MKGYLEVENEEWRGICEKTTDLAAEFEGARCRSTVGSMHSEICCLVSVVCIVFHTFYHFMI
ncbi:hypothetical protein ACS0TY_017300 [Phlomoides rotata]